MLEIYYVALLASQPVRLEIFSVLVIASGSFEVCRWKRSVTCSVPVTGWGCDNADDAAEEQDCIASGHA